MSQSLYTDLGPLLRTSVPIAQYLLSTVARQEIDLIQIQRDLEAENIEWSNKKITKVTHALKVLLHKYTLAAQEDRDTYKEDLGKKCVQTKHSQTVIDAICDEMAQIVTKEVAKMMKLQQLVDFQVLLRHDFASLECKNVNETRAQLLFKIRQNDGGI